MFTKPEISFAKYVFPLTIGMYASKIVHLSKANKILAKD